MYICIFQKKEFGTSESMVEELRRVLVQRLTEMPDIVALVISDKDGVPILQASTDNSPAVDLCLRYQFLSTNAIISDSSKKVKLQGMKKSLISYNDKQILSFCRDQLTLSIIGQATANTGQMENIAKQLFPVMKDVSRAVLG